MAGEAYDLATFRLLWEICALVLGLCIGSFLNVVIARLPAGLSVVKPRSRCPRCEKGIAWYDNFPVVSWVVLRAKCRSCGLPISPRYPTVELLTGLLALALAQRYGVDWRVLTFLAFVALLVAIAYIDLDYWIIPDELSITGIVLGLLASLVNPDLTFVDALIGGAAGFASFALVGFVGAKVFRKEALGQGDWFLLAMIGAFLGWKALLPVILLSSLQGAIVGIALIRLDRNRGAAPSPIPVPVPVQPGSTLSGPGEGTPVDSEDDWQPSASAIPFGPFLVLAALEQLFLGDWLYGLYAQLMAKLVL